jgi:uncharacterized cofD-like protein
MALAALCRDDEWGRTWANVLQHRFSSDGELHDHSVGNLLIVALWELLGEAVDGLDWVARLLGAQGRVLPMSAVPLDITARVIGLDPLHPDVITEIRGQAEVATTEGHVVDVALDPADPPACPEALVAIAEADWVVVGPGSWFTSVIPNLLVPALARGLQETNARRLVTLNLGEQKGETDGFSPETHLEVLAAHAPELRIDVVLADEEHVPDPASLRRSAESLGAVVVIADIADDQQLLHHDPAKLAKIYREIFE